MKTATLNRQHVIAVMAGAHQRLQAAAEGTQPMEGVSADEAARMAAELQRGLDFTQNVEPALAAEGELDDAGAADEYISRNDVVSLVQSAIDEAHTSGPTLAAAAAPAAAPHDEHFSFVADLLRFTFRDRAPFPRHQVLTDFRFPLPDRCTVALVGDWGTGLPGAVAVAQAIRARHPDVLIHLGDVYPAGTPEECDRHFIDLMTEHGPPRTSTKYWAMNGNHEMFAKGIGYFGKILPFCDQPASYFSLGNDRWRLIALDSAYTEYTLQEPQSEWLNAQLAESGPRNVLLTHHQVFSAVDGRPEINNAAIELGAVAASGAVYGWFWGHEHGCLAYGRAESKDDRKKYRGLRARCIGHGGKPVKLPYFTRPKHHAPPVEHHWELARPDDPASGLNGFALLEFDGPKLHISYIDETNVVRFDESWDADEPPFPE